MTVDLAVLDKLRGLPLKKQQEVLDSIDFLKQKQQKTRHPRREWIGTASNLKVELTEKDVAEARREMWQEKV